MENTIDSTDHPKYKELRDRKERMRQIIADKTPAMRTSKMEEWGMICMKEFAKQELSAYKERLKKQILSEYDWTNSELINMIDTL